VLSHWTLSNETSILDRSSLPLTRTPPCCKQPHRTGHGFSLGLPDKSSPRTMTLAPSGVRHAPSLKKVKTANKGRGLPSRTNALGREENLGADTTEEAIQPSKESNTPSRPRGLPPRGSLARPPRKLNLQKNPYSNTSAQTGARDLLSRVSIRGTPASAQNVRTHKHFEA